MDYVKVIVVLIVINVLQGADVSKIYVTKPIYHVILTMIVLEVLLYAPEEYVKVIFLLHCVPPVGLALKVSAILSFQIYCALQTSKL
jgi:hypothetical protein